MRKVWSVAASFAVVVLCGCQHTHVDQVKASDGMRDWYQDIKSNYPGFQPPKLISPGISGQNGPAIRDAAEEKAAANTENGDIEALPVDPVQPQPAETAVEPEVKAAPAEEVAPLPEVKSDAKAEVKSDAKAETGKIEPPDPTSGEIYVVQSGDTLGALSKKFYGSVRYVNMLQKANSDIITNANVLKPGMKLIIPKL